MSKESKDIQPVGMTRAEFAARVGISLSTLERMMRRKRVPHCRFGGRVIFLDRHVEEFCERHEVRPVQKSK